MTVAIDLAGNAASKRNRFQSVGKTDEIAETQKLEFLRKNTFMCKANKIRMTKASCIAYQKKALTAKGCDPETKCLECKKFDKTKLPKLAEKKCRLETEFPGYCTGPGRFKRPVWMTTSLWESKECCSKECSMRYHNFKSVGYKTNADVSKVRQKLKRK